MLVATMVFFSACGLIANNTDTLANNSSSSGTTSSAVSYSMTKTELEEALTKYKEIAETLSGRVDALEQLVSDMTASTGSHIGAYAVTLVDSVMNLACVESQYNIGCQGTGFIITDDGYVITNNHVVYYETTVYDTSKIINYGFFGGVTYATKTVDGVYSSITGVFDKDSKYYGNGTVYNLEFVYRDAKYDLALCKIVEAVPVGESWSAIPFYDGKTVRGDELLVLGNASGLGLSATSGIVSMTGKTFDDYPDLTFIQTDAAINSGNSGGPAVNIYGALVGVVNSKFVSSSIENMGFAIELDKLEIFIADAEAAAEAAGSPITVRYATKSANSDTSQEAEQQDPAEEDPIAA